MADPSLNKPVVVQATRIDASILLATYSVSLTFCMS